MRQPPEFEIRRLDWHGPGQDPHYHAVFTATGVAICGAKPTHGDWPRWLKETGDRINCPRCRRRLHRYWESMLVLKMGIQGRVYHGIPVIQGRIEKSACGRKPKPQSNGWNELEPGDRINCPRCLQRLIRSRGSAQLTGIQKPDRGPTDLRWKGKVGEPSGGSRSGAFREKRDQHSDRPRKTQGGGHGN